MTVRRISAERLAALLAPSSGGRPAYKALADGIRGLMADGRLLHGTRLPSERELTAALAVSRTTVSRAYAELRDLGYLATRWGSGSVALLPGGGRGGHTARLLPATVATRLIDLSLAAPAALPGMAAAFRAAVEELPAYLTHHGYHPLGLPGLRAALAERYSLQGLPTEPEQVLVSSGALAAIVAVATALLGPRDRVLVESPGYPNAIAAVARSGAHVIGLPMEPDGWDLTAIEASLRQASPRMALLVPDFQNPTGALMSASDRERLAQALAHTQTVGVVDETLRDLALDVTAMPPPLPVFHPEVIAVGGASKSHWGGLRIGWLRAPARQLPRLTDALLSLSHGPPLLEQLVLLRLLEAGQQAAEARQQELRATRDATAAALQERLPEWTFTLPKGGLTLWCRLPRPLSAQMVVAAEREGVLIAPGSAFAAEGDLASYLRIPYTLETETMREAVDRLALAWASLLQGRELDDRHPSMVV